MFFTFGNPQITNIVKISIVSLIFGLLMINTLSGQVKIGNNPQNLNPASVLELESTNRVLVITRVTDAQMNLINPLEGAIVYNTDQECLHYYNGTEWINICEELDNSFTVSTRADYLSLLNPQARDSTVVISQTNNPDGSINYNYEVGQITGANIVTQSINADSKIQPTSITTGLLAPKSVTIGKFADATGGQPGDIFQWNGSQWTLVNESVLGITEKDSIVGNEVVGPSDATLLLNGNGSEAVPFTLDVSEGGITAFEIATGAVTTEEILNGTILEEDIANDAVTTAKIADANVTLAKLTDGANPGELMQWNGTSWVLVDETALNITEADGIVGNEVTNTTDGTLTRSGTGTLADPFTLGVSTGGITDNEIAADAVTTAKIADANVTLAKLTDGANPGELMQWNGTSWVLVDETALNITEADGIVGNEVTNTTDGTLTRSGTGTLADPFTLGVSTGGITDNEIAADAVTTAKIADANVTLAKLTDGANPGELMQWNGTSWVLVDETALNITEADGIVGNEVTNTTDGTLTRSGTGTLADPFTLGVSTGGITDNEIAADAVTTAKIADANVTLAKLTDGANPGELMQWNGTSWVLVDETALNITEADGIVGNEVTNTTDGTLTRSGTGTLADPFTLGVSTGGITDNEIAADAVTTAKIADANVTLAKLTDGANPGELMQWNGTSWVLVDETALNITEADGIVGNEVTNTTDGTLTRSGTGTLADPFTLGVSTGGITDNEIAADAVTTAKIADANVTLAKLTDGANPGELMQWNGTSWVLVDETALNITEADGIVGNEVTNTTDGTLTRSGTGTLADPFTLGVSTGGITDNEIAADAVTTAKIADANVTLAKIAPGTNGQVLTTTGGTVSWQPPAVIAMGKVNSDATVVNSTGASVVQNSTGNYTVTLNNAIPTADYIVQLTLQNTGGNVSIEVTAQGSTTFTVRTWELSTSTAPGPLTLTPIDSEWFFTVTDF